MVTVSIVAAFLLLDGRRFAGISDQALPSSASHHRVLALVWMGYVLGISFFEAPIKFRVSAFDIDASSSALSPSCTSYIHSAYGAAMSSDITSIIFDLHVTGQDSDSQDRA